jgi:hypothetical protein
LLYPFCPPRRSQPARIIININDGILKSKGLFLKNFNFFKQFWALTGMSELKAGGQRKCQGKLKGDIRGRIKGKRLGVYLTIRFLFLSIAGDCRSIVFGVRAVFGQVSLLVSYFIILLFNNLGMTVEVFSINLIWLTVHFGKECAV